MAPGAADGKAVRVSRAAQLLPRFAPDFPLWLGRKPRFAAKQNSILGKLKRKVGGAWKTPLRVSRNSCRGKPPRDYDGRVNIGRQRARDELTAAIAAIKWPNPTQDCLDNYDRAYANETGARDRMNQAYERVRR
jgi:hypothetical protein